MNDAFVVEADLALEPTGDPRAPGGAVTSALCGHWEHEGACRWPHNNEIDVEVRPARLRIIVVATDDRSEPTSRIEHALRRDVRWQLVRLEVREISDTEQELARRLTRP